MKMMRVSVACVNKKETSCAAVFLACVCERAPHYLKTGLQYRVETALGTGS
jgi:hypothetical protein